MTGLDCKCVVATSVRWQQIPVVYNYVRIYVSVYVYVRMQVSCVCMYTCHILHSDLKRWCGSEAPTKHGWPTDWCYLSLVCAAWSRYLGWAAITSEKPWLFWLLPTHDREWPISVLVMLVIYYICYFLVKWRYGIAHF